VRRGGFKIGAQAHLPSGRAPARDHGSVVEQHSLIPQQILSRTIRRKGQRQAARERGNAARPAGSAPDGNLAGVGQRAIFLASSACRWRIYDLRLDRGVHDSIRLVEGVERVGCTGLALAPATVVSGVPVNRYRIWRQVHPPSMGGPPMPAAGLRD
jgi:hypothetical protein